MVDISAFNQGRGPAFQKRVIEGSAGDHTPQHPWASLFQGAGEENLVDSQTWDSGKTLWK